MEEVTNNFQLNDFIYLDTNFLESYTAQKYKGFPEKMQIANTYENVQENIGEKFESESNINGKVSGGIFGASGEYKERRGESQFNQTNTEITQNVDTKVHKDNMFNDFLEYVQEKGQISGTSNIVTGKYIELQDVFYYIDFDRIYNLCNEEYRETYHKYDENTPEFTSARLEEIRIKCNLLKELIPFDAILCSEKFMILIDQKWLRRKKEHLGYIIDGEISVVGNVNKIWHKNSDSTVPSIKVFK